MTTETPRVSRMARRRLAMCGGWFALAGLLTLAGCGASSGPVKLDKQVAQDGFKAFLEAWKAGEQQTALKDKKPSIVANDPAWANGAKLVSYQLVDMEKNDGSNLRPTVELVLQTAQGQRTTQITYVVTSHPVITVFRDDS